MSARVDCVPVLAAFLLRSASFRQPESIFAWAHFSEKIPHDPLSFIRLLVDCKTFIVMIII
jgi:hypothetical protein